ncbi:PRC-barrel domain-containing protein [Roseitranquillus sediminis]|uniref:PRC-barrel domain-containing protein n=1 Tax=Roseitranquillus sediminis TaxID=2809051 RepID=UPI001D0C67DA|nr:PRC-barrel domain-containing protein [Roseitranquillus sediminis]MBM9596071.1 PRC-barrel domain-containing protein [Roseitranquillus sediminis]
MKRLATTASALMLAAAPAIAQDTLTDTTDTMAMGGELDYARLIRTRDITGGPVYTTNEAWDEGAWGVGDGVESTENVGAVGDGMAAPGYRWGWTGYNEVGSDWNQIGEIEDVVLDQSGQLVGVVVEVGGFLDIGDKHVMLRVGDVDLVPVDDQTYSLVTRYSEEELENMEGVDEGWWN